MSRLIDADKTLKGECKSCLCEEGSVNCLACEIKGVLNNAPSVDAVRVVRCKDCKWCHAGYCERADTLIPNGRPDDDWEHWFCADGERKGE